MNKAKIVTFVSCALMQGKCIGINYNLQLVI